ncbi:hypothetical protein HX021_19725 [Sphingobacterium sp. N143]|uniref:hypothetical protein n=1 Tax=Sphingobacterium sp. N143 TaxID=2746727 RepID=UPI002574B6EB|nr:hypothetical protein [Sphingobacterium sp. N143]MDM1296521.1 hypothetical protein [Sphingobacterium sp. N143]
MNQKYSNVLALELAIYQVHEPAYDPIKKIVEFWSKYDINTIQNTINMLLKKSADRLASENVLEICHKQVFAVDMMTVLIAYFHVHKDFMDIGKIDISEAEKTLISLDELEITKRIHEFFGRIAE